ncbi:MAG: hypothetical protein KME04_03170 [Pleurocapsa minor GSE-CHR-MK-17-07R]|nr:hypothetical protein [Pleurocapsa minor GSE-CHR-MK 17-07R]
MPQPELSELATKTDALLAEALSLKFDDPNRLLAVAEEAAQLAQQLGDFRRFARALVHQAWAHSFLNKFEVSLSCALEALSLSHDFQLKEVEALAVGMIAIDFLKCGLLHEASLLFEHQIRLGEQLGSAPIICMAYNDLSVVKMEQNDFVTATYLLRQSLAHAPENGTGTLEGLIAHLNLAWGCVKTGQYEEGIRHAQIVLERMHNYPRYQSDAHLWVATAHLAQGDLEQASERIATARAVVENAQPPVYNVNVESLTAQLHMARGQYEEAANVWERVLKTATDQAEVFAAITALNDLKTVYELSGDTEGLIRTYKRLAEDIPAQQKHTNDLRFSVLRTVFSREKEAMEAQLDLGKQKSTILRRLSHEFRTPLAIIESSSNMLSTYLDRMSLQQRQEHLKNINQQVGWMTVMLDDILNMLSWDDATVYQKSTFSIDELVAGALEHLARYRISGDRLRVTQGDGAHRITAPRTALQIIVVHLLSNGIKFSRDEVRLDVSWMAEQLTISVVDHGIGIPDKEHQEVFLPLVRASNLDEINGIGAGLAIVSRLVRNMHGHIRMDSELGKGTSVQIQIPLY